MIVVQDDQIVALVRHRGRIRYFVSYSDLWVLDWRSWCAMFVEAGFGEQDTSFDGRFGIGVVDTENAVEFLERMATYEVQPDVLESLKDVDGNRVHPTLWVDFDTESVVVDGVESPPVGEFVPSGWTVRYGSVSEVLRSSEQQAD